MESEGEKSSRDYSIIFLGPNGEVGGLNSGIGNTKEEAISTGGKFDSFFMVARHPTEDKFIVVPIESKVHMYVVVNGFFPQGMAGLTGVNRQGEIIQKLSPGKGLKPSEVDAMVKKGTIVINQRPR